MARAGPSETVGAVELYSFIVLHRTHIGGENDDPVEVCAVELVVDRGLGVEDGDRLLLQVVNSMHLSVIPSGSLIL